jgi:hypothetical protein
MPARYIASWPADAPGTAARSWLTATRTAVRPYASGTACQNHPDPGLTGRREASHSPAAARSEQLKTRYDPTGSFTCPQAL